MYPVCTLLLVRVCIVSCCSPNIHSRKQARWKRIYAQEPRVRRSSHFVLVFVVLVLGFCGTEGRSEGGLESCSLSELRAAILGLEAFVSEPSVRAVSSTNKRQLIGSSLSTPKSGSFSLAEASNRVVIFRLSNRAIANRNGFSIPRTLLRNRFKRLDRFNPSWMPLSKNSVGRSSRSSGLAGLRRYQAVVRYRLSLGEQ
jgi:hypothetical protein